MDLAGRFVDLLHGLGATSDSRDLASALLSAWAEPHRVYHDTRHMIDCLEQLDGAPDEGGDRRMVEAALWFHDAVYDPRAYDNEARSAEWAERALQAAGIPPARAAEAGRLVLLTRHTTPADDPDGRLLCDVDLSILGRGPAEYDEFERRVRAEYAWVPESSYRAGRGRILAGLLARDPIYRTAHFRTRYESAARDNLARALRGLGG